jgi:hypothetical protein
MGFEAENDARKKAFADWCVDAPMMARAKPDVSGSFANLALSLRLPKDAEESKLTFDFFQGFAPFSPLELAEEKNWQKVWTAAYRSADKAGMAYRIATISPGYDDHSLDDEVRQGNQYRVVARENGETYQKGMKFVEGLAKPPHLVMISTFNEFHENSHIEPSIKNGMRYVELTQSFVARIKDKVSDGKR